MNPAKAKSSPINPSAPDETGSEPKLFAAHSPSGEILSDVGAPGAAPQSDDAPVAAQASVTLVPEQGWQKVDLGELWRYRELLWFMAMRDVQVRYKQTVLGAAWAIIQPVMSMIVFSIVFGKFGKIPSDGIPYPIFVFTALLPWQLFANTLGQSSNSLVANTNLLTKIFFPRLIIPLSAALSGLVDFCIAFLVLVGLMLFYHDAISPSWGVLFLPFLVLFALVAGLAMGLWLSALNVQFRDVRYVVPFVAQIWLYASPVAYSSTLVPEQYRLLFALNPMTGVIEGFRWALLGSRNFSPAMLGVSVLATFAILVGGLYYFRRVEATFADLA